MSEITKTISQSNVKMSINIKGNDMIKLKLIHNTMDDIIRCQLVFRDAVSWMTALKNIMASVEIEIIEFHNNMTNKIIRNAILICQF